MFLSDGLLKDLVKVDELCHNKWGQILDAAHYSFAILVDMSSTFDMGSIGMRAKIDPIAIAPGAALNLVQFPIAHWFNTKASPRTCFADHSVDWDRLAGFHLILRTAHC